MPTKAQLLEKNVTLSGEVKKLNKAIRSLKNQNADLNKEVKTHTSIAHSLREDVRQGKRIRLNLEAVAQLCSKRFVKLSWLRRTFMTRKSIRTYLEV